MDNRRDMGHGQSASAPCPKGFERIDGTLIPKRVGTLASWIGGDLFGRLSRHVEAGGLGMIWSAGLPIQCFPGDTTRVRRPAVAFVERSRWSNDMFGGDTMRIAPDLVVEVVTSATSEEALGRMVEDYGIAGVRLTWVVDASTRTMHIHRADGSSARLTDDAELSGEGVIPGFLCRVADLFPPLPVAGPA